MNLSIQLRKLIWLPLLLVCIKLSAQPYLNGNLSTGVLSKDSITAPPGYTWSQTQFTNRTLGFSASVAGNATIADDFIVPAGQIWNISALTVYAYSSNYSSTTCPFNAIRFKIFDADPSTSSANTIFGDLTTSRSITGSSAMIYRIRDTANTAREIWSIKTNLSLSLNPGNYWIEWQLGNISGVTSSFSPPSTYKDVIYSPSYNGLQHNLATNTWGFLLDQGSASRQDMPFRIDYTANFPTPCAGLPNPGNTISSPTAPCLGNSFSLSLQNNPFVTGLSYQWQSSGDSINWNNISGATAKTYTDVFTTPTLYRAIVICGADTSFSNPIRIKIPTLFVSTQPINRSAVCSDSIYFSFIRGGSATVSKYQWQQRINSTATWSNIYNSSLVSGTDDNTLKLLLVQVAQTNYQYRAVYYDSCGNRDSTNPAILTVGSISPRLTPASATICAGISRSISITSKPNTLATFSSGSLSVVIPDTVTNGATSAINVSGIPADAVITGVSVKLNIRHAFIGELAVAIKAPNNNALNLDYFLSSTSSSNATSGFTNTVFSSNGTKVVGDSSTPFTGVFRADKIINTNTDYPAGPTSVMPNITSWSSLYSIPNGTWTLGLFDSEIGDQGTLSSWSIDITYIIPGTAVWSPSSSQSIYSNSTATSLYVTNSQAATIYVKPLITTTYGAVIKSLNCGTSTPKNITVTVNGNKSLFAKDTVNVCDTVYTLKADSGFVSYTWNTGDTGRTITVRNTGTYKCSVAESSCTSSDSVVVRLGNRSLSGVMSVCEKFIWNGITYTNSGIYTKTINFDSCSATDTLNLTIRKGSYTSSLINTCNSYNWKGTTYTTSGTYIINSTNTSSCPSSDTLYLTIRNGTYTVDARKACDSLRWNQVLYTTSGTYIYNYTNTAGCVSADTLKLTVYYSNNIETTTACNSYYWHSTNYTQNGNYIYNYINPAGCPAVDTLKLTIRTGNYGSQIVTACDKYLWNGITYTQNGTYLYTYFNTYGCASIDTLKLTIKSSTHNIQTQTACETYTWNSQTYTTSGNYLYNYTNSLGCPSTDTLKLTIRNGSHMVSIQNACDSFIWNGTTYQRSGTYTYNYNNTYGCGSTDTLKLNIYLINFSQSQTACDSFKWKGNTYTQSGIYTWANTYPEGCSTVDTLLLTINNSSHNVEIKDTCENYTWHGTTYRNNGIYNYNYINTFGCSSTDTLKLTIRFGTYNTETIAACSSYVWRGNTYTSSGTYSSNYINTDGCPSTDTLKLSIGYNTNISDTQNVCDKYIWNGNTYTTSGIYSFNNNNSFGCLAADTLNLTIRLSSHNVETKDICDSISWNGSVFKTNGTYLYNYVNVSNCPSTDTLKLFVRLGSHNVTTQNQCDSFRWNGTTYRNTGLYTYGYMNASNCYSVDTLKLTIRNSTHNVISPTSCDSYVWNGNTYTTTGTYIYNYTNTAGCASTDTMKLTIKLSSHIVTIKDTCDIYIWKGNTYTTGGTYTSGYVNTVGCASVDTLKLTLRYSSHNVTTQNQCDSFRWNGIKYTSSGTYSYRYNNVGGCPSVDTLKLTIKSSTHILEIKDTCENYSWRGNIYSISGIYTYNYSNGIGCPSADTLKLTIRNGSHNVLIQNACDSFRWNGTKYILSGIYTYNYINLAGCSSADTLKLTVDTINFWKGTVSATWENPANWSCGRVPDATTTIKIEAPAVYYPVISSMAACKKIYTSEGAALIINDGFKLDVSGTDQ